jgi:hypothetical protein
MPHDAFAQLNPYHVFGQSPTAARADGAGLPRSTHTSLDHAGSPLSPDSGAFWLGLLIVATALGIAGASVRVHAGPLRAGASAGKD